MAPDLPPITTLRPNDSTIPPRRSRGSQSKESPPLCSQPELVKTNKLVDRVLFMIRREGSSTSFQMSAVLFSI
jgi:hypothetical protein